MEELVPKWERQSMPINTESKLLTTYMLPKLAALHDSGRVVFFMSTNFQETFDDAIKRAGRFDLLLCMGPPTLKAKCNCLHRFYVEYEGRDGDDNTRAAGNRILTFAERDTWIADQLSLFTFGEFEAF